MRRRQDSGDRLVVMEDAITADYRLYGPLRSMRDTVRVTARRVFAGDDLHRPDSRGGMAIEELLGRGVLEPAPPVDWQLSIAYRWRVVTADELSWVDDIPRNGMAKWRSYARTREHRRLATFGAAIDPTRALRFAFQAVTGNPATSADLAARVPARARTAAISVLAEVPRHLDDAHALDLVLAAK